MIQLAAELPEGKLTDELLLSAFRFVSASSIKFQLPLAVDCSNLEFKLQLELARSISSPEDWFPVASYALFELKMLPPNMLANHVQAKASICSIDLSRSFDCIKACINLVFSCCTFSCSLAKFLTRFSRSKMRFSSLRLYIDKLGQTAHTYILTDTVSPLLVISRLVLVIITLCNHLIVIGILLKVLIVSQGQSRLDVTTAVVDHGLTELSKARFLVHQFFLSLFSFDVLSSCVVSFVCCVCFCILSSSLSNS